LFLLEGGDALGQTLQLTTLVEGEPARTRPSFRLWPLVRQWPLPARRRGDRGGAGNAGRLAQVILITADVLDDATAAVEGERAGDDPVQEDAIVADQQDRSRKVGNQLLEQLEGLDVEIVGGLVEHEDVCRPGKEPRQQQ